MLKGIWKAYGNAHRVAGRAKFSPNVFAEFLTKCMLCHNSDARVAARRSFAFGRTFFVDTCDAGYKELTYINFLEALFGLFMWRWKCLCLGILEIGVNDWHFYELLLESSWDAIHATIIGTHAGAGHGINAGGEIGAGHAHARLF